MASMMHKIGQGMGLEDKHHDKKSSSSNSDLVSLLTQEQLKDLTLLVTQATEEQRKWLLTCFEEEPKRSFKEKLGLGDDDDGGDGKEKDEGALKLPPKPPRPQEKAEGTEPVLEDERHKDVHEQKKDEEKEGFSESVHHLQEKYEDYKHVHEKHKEEHEKEEKEENEEKEKKLKSESTGSLSDAKEGNKLDNQKVNIKQKELEAAVLTSFDDWQQRVLARIAEVVNDRSRDAGADAHIQSEAPENAEAAKSVVEETESEKAPQLPPRPKSVDDPRDVHNILYPTIDTPLKKFLAPAAKPMIVHSLLLLLLSLETYDARSRTLLRLCASSIGVKNSVLMQQEISVAQSLVKAARGMSGEEERKKAEEEGKWGRRIKIGLAGVAGAAVIGITGGLAAPLLAAGIGTVMSGIGLGATAAAGYLGALASSGALVGTLFGAYGAKMTGEMMERYSSQIKDFAFIPIKPKDKDENRLAVTIGISGWLTAKEEVIEPWRALSENSEVYALRWETDALLDLGSSLQTILKSYAISLLKKEIIMRTVLATLFTALWPIGLLKVARVVDNPFAIAQTRAMKTGRLLADALINKAQGERPVTLIGYSIGSRVIYSCLMTLAERKATGLIENVYILGAPAPTSNDTDWAAMRSVVSGRLVNVYSENDYILAFLYRATAAELGAAGLQPIEWPQAIENVDVSKDVEGHLRYRHLVGSILGRIGGSEMVDWGVVGEEMEIAELLRKEEKKRDEEMEGKEGSGEGEKEMEDVVKEVEKEQMDRRNENIAKAQQGQAQMRMAI